MRPDERPPDHDRCSTKRPKSSRGRGGPGSADARPDYHVDDDRDTESFRPLEEAGEGEAEGFELAEHDLVEEASHGEEGTSPRPDAFTPELESDEADSVYGEADDVEGTDS